MVATSSPDGGWNSSRNFHGEQRRNDTHASTTDDEARLFRQGAGKEARLCFMGHLLMENRSGLVVATRLTQAPGLAERAAASALLEDPPGRHRITVGADRGYDTSDFVAALRQLNATPHVAQNLSRRASRIDRGVVCGYYYGSAAGLQTALSEQFARASLSVGIVRAIRQWQPFRPYLLGFGHKTAVCLASTKQGATHGQQPAKEDYQIVLI